MLTPFNSEVIGDTSDDIWPSGPPNEPVTPDGPVPPDGPVLPVPPDGPVLPVPPDELVLPDEPVPPDELVLPVPPDEPVPPDVPVCPDDKEADVVLLDIELSQLGQSIVVGSEIPAVTKSIWPSASRSAAAADPENSNRLMNPTTSFSITAPVSRRP